MAFIWSNIPLDSAPGLDCLKVFLVSSGALSAQFKGNYGSLSSISFHTQFHHITLGTKERREVWRDRGKERRKEGVRKISKFFHFSWSYSLCLSHKCPNTEISKYLLSVFHSEEKISAVFVERQKRLVLINERTFAIFLHEFCPASYLHLARFWYLSKTTELPKTVVNTYAIYTCEYTYLGQRQVTGLQPD